ncbi:MAG: hypothetical protein ACE3JP_02815 [Ectobacillus sp.]
MILQYSIKYTFRQGDRLIQEMVVVSASSESFAIQKVTDEIIRRFGCCPAIQVHALLPVEA